jgi:arginyl-tRNA--protein-N-Asp/Glu arginylyltransferase
MYRLDGRLIAIGVLDILPSCVSSVYFMYDKTWERFSMGKVGGLLQRLTGLLNVYSSVLCEKLL